MNLDDLDKEHTAKATRPRQQAPILPSSNWRALLWTPMSHRKLCLACRYGKQHSSTDCLDEAMCECPCWSYKDAFSGMGGMD